MGIRDLKRDALTRAQRQERREAGEAWWQKSARQARQERRQAGEAWWQVSGNATEPAAQVVIPPNLGGRLPGPGTPGARTTGARGGGNGTANGTAAPWYMNPLFLAVAAGGAWYFLAGKKK